MSGQIEALGAGLELWAGAECTVNRVRDTYFDQLRRTGHWERLDDIDRLAALGIRRARVPVLWERTAPRCLDDADFRWSDVRLGRLAELGVQPILGLVHHGSGPPHTDLCRASFATGLASFAERVAEQYPWVEAYTPVNEPLTTARFSCLYGHWYPHERQLVPFVTAVMSQVRATRLAMAAIRRINPHARLYQTEDLGQVFSTPDLAEQRRYENHRRWLSLDLLFGRVGRDHPLRRHLEEHGAAARELDEWSAEPCAPDLVGINYYVTSDRFLDSRLELYPPHTWGGNGRQSYADVEAVRARAEGIAGHRAVIEETWARYGAPVALTEVHLACHREDQLRWLAEAWNAARAARAAGADVRAVTLWSAFGAVGWHDLVTTESNHYEAGAYDIRAPEPRPTATALLAAHLARGEVPPPLARAAGWWQQARRLSFREAHGEGVATPERSRLLVIGTGTFARRVAESCEPRFDCLTAPNLAAAHAMLARRNLGTAGPAPWAAIMAFDPARAAPDVARELRAHWGALCACSDTSLPLLALSCDRLFNGWGARPYSEGDVPDALDAEGTSWRAFESAVSSVCSQALIVRAGYVIDALSPSDSLAVALESLRREDAPELPTWELIAPTYLPHLIDSALDLLVDGERAIWHLTHAASCSPFELVRRCAALLGLPFQAQPAPSSRRRARGPMRVLESERGWPLPDLSSALSAYTRAFELRSTASDGLIGTAAR